MKGTKSNGRQSTANTLKPPAPDDIPPELAGEFERLDGQLIANLGTICGLATAGGGYFGFSISDDGGSCKLSVRHRLLTYERRCYSLVQLEALTAYCARKLADS